MTTHDESNDDETVVEPPPFQASTADKEATRRRQALFLRQALVIADRFSRNPVSHSMLAAAIPWLEREQYDNIAVERNAHGNCGYVLCPNPLGEPISQLYRISSATRRVFDLTHRKPFCSDWCYAASNHVRSQIPTDPGWCRTQSETKTLTLLASNSRSYPGKLVLDGLRRMRLSDDDTHSLSEDDDDTDHSKSRSVSDPSESEQTSASTSGSSSPVPQLPKTYAEEKRSLSAKVKNELTETSWGVKVEIPKHNLVVERSTQLIQSDQEGKSPLIQPVNPEDSSYTNTTVDLFTKIEMRLSRWMSRKAFRILINSGQSTDSDVPSDDDVPRETCDHETGPEHCSSSPPGILPLLESVSADTLRRHLLMEELIPSINAILFKIDVPTRSVLSTIENAVTYFRLTNRNLHLNRLERGLISLALLRLMAGSHACLAQLLNDECLSSFLKTMTTEPLTEFLEKVIQPVHKHFEELST